MGNKKSKRRLPLGSFPEELIERSIQWRLRWRAGNPEAQPAGEWDTRWSGHSWKYLSRDIPVDADYWRCRYDRVEYRLAKSIGPWVPLWAQRRDGTWGLYQGDLLDDPAGQETFTWGTR